MKIRSILGFIILLYSLTTFASGFTVNETYFVLLQFDKVAFGKKVAEVMVHTGVYVNDGLSESSWNGVKDIVLEKKERGFFGKTIIDGYYPASSTTQSNNGSIAVQYWVTFEDGSTLVTETSYHALNYSLSCGYAEELAKFNNITYSPETKIFAKFNSSCAEL